MEPLCLEHTGLKSTSLTTPSFPQVLPFLDPVSTTRAPCLLPQYSLPPTLTLTGDSHSKSCSFEAAVLACHSADKNLFSRQRHHCHSHICYPLGSMATLGVL